jgi:F0F1-type ATP synthase delta subunit
MKASPKNLAKAIFELSRQEPANAKKYVKDLVSKLVKEGQRQALTLVLSELETLQNKADGLQKIKIESARPVDASVKELIVSSLKNKKLLKNEAVFNEKINADLLGGVRLQIDDMLLDASYAGVFKQFQRQLKK